MCFQHLSYLNPKQLWAVKSLVQFYKKENDKTRFLNNDIVIIIFFSQRKLGQNFDS